MLEEAMENGYVPSTEYVLADYFHGITREKDHKKVLDLVKPFANKVYVEHSKTGHYIRWEFEYQRDVAALYHSFLYVEGNVIPKDLESAKSFYEEARKFFNDISSSYIR